MDSKVKYRIGKSSIFQAMAIALSVICVMPLIAILFFIIKSGISRINWDLITQVEKPVGELGGGIAHALAGSMLVILFASIIAIPTGILCGIYLSENKKSRLIIKVTDNGIGIPDDDQSHIFSRFFRARNAEVIQGTGIGLNIVKKYIDLLGGKISFKSIENSGTTFTAEIPVLK